MQEGLLAFLSKSLPADLRETVQEHILNIEHGNFRPIFDERIVKVLVGREEVEHTKDILPEDFGNWQDYISHRLKLLFRNGYVGVHDKSSQSSQLVLLLAAFAALNAFMQSNVTGPVLPFAPAKLLFPHILNGDKSALSRERSRLVSALGSDGAAAYKLTPDIELLCFADSIIQTSDIIANVVAWRWLRLRVNFLHQRLLSEISPSLQKVIYADQDFIHAVLSHGRDGTEADPSFVPFLLEQAAIYLHHGMDKEAKEAIRRATELRRFDFAITGLLGKRTKYQTEDTSQLVVLATSHSSEDTVSSATRTQNGVGAAGQRNGVSPDPEGPKLLDLNDDTLLESILFTTTTSQGENTSVTSNLPASLAQLDPSAQPRLEPLDSIILLLTASSITNNNPADGITREETLPYAIRVLEGGSSNWQVYTQALLVRSRIEGYSPRKVERGLLQLQAVVDQVIADTSGAQRGGTSDVDDTADGTASFLPKSKDEAGASASQRLSYVFQLCSPYRWDLEAELASRWVTLGGLRSALDIYTRLEMWPEAALCLAATDNEAKARRMVRRQLYHATFSADEGGIDEDAERWEGQERDPPPQDAPRLYCILADIDKDVAFYEKAWQVSGERYTRAQRSLGRHYWSEGDYAKAALAYNKSLKIKQLDHGTWFALGCCLLELLQFQRAVEAFTRAVQMDDSDAESWSNLAAALLRLEPPEAAPQPAAQQLENIDSDTEASDRVPPPINPQKHTQEALNALRKAAKHAPTNYRILSNLLSVAAMPDPPSWNDILHAQSRIIDLRGQTEGEGCIDVLILKGLVAHIIAGGPFDPSKPGLARLVVQMLETKVLPLITASRELWLVIADTYAWRGKARSALEAHEKAWRAVTQRPGWENSTEEADWDAVVAATLELVQAYQRFGPMENAEGLAVGSGELVAKDWRFKGRNALRGIMGKGRANWEGSGGWERLVGVMEDLKV